MVVCLGNGVIVVLGVLVRFVMDNVVGMVDLVVGLIIVAAVVVIKEQD